MKAATCRWVGVLVCVCLVSLAGCVADSPSLLERPQEQVEVKKMPIVGGQDTRIELFPWQVSLQRYGSHFCGGAIVNESWIVTAAHCVEDSVRGVQVRAGVTERRSRAGQVRGVDGLVVYPGYVSPERGKDIALIKLDAPLNFNAEGVSPIGLLTPALAREGYAEPQTVATVTGWGALSAGGRSPERLQRVDVPIVHLERAREAYGYLGEDQLAAGLVGVGGKDSCQGDSGGPLVVQGPGGRPLLAGVVSWGRSCASARYPGMYARVSTFAAWVQGHVGTLVEVPAVDDAPEPDAGQATSELSAGELQVWGPFDVAQGQVFHAELQGSGDPDLYLRYGAPPTVRDFDCRSWAAGAEESCALEGGQGERLIYVMVHAYKDASFDLYTGLEVVQGAAQGPERFTVEGSVEQGEKAVYDAIELEGGSKLVVSLAGSGDADLYVRFGASPTLRAYDCRPYAGDSDETCTLTVPEGGAEAFVEVVGYTPSDFTVSFEFERRL